MRNVFILFLLFNAFVIQADETRLISVEGNAEKSFEPDIVRLIINIWGKGNSAKKAQANNQVHFDVLKKSVDTFKIKKEDIHTISYDMNPDTSYDPKTNKNITNGYIVNQSMNVTLKKIEDAGSFIDSLSNYSKATTGGVSVQSLVYDISKRQFEETKLLGEAVKDAEAKAQLLATAARVHIKSLFRLSPHGNSAPGPVMFQKMGAASMDASGAGRTETMSGQVKAAAQIHADYLIE